MNVTRAHNRRRAAMRVAFSAAFVIAATQASSSAQVTAPTAAGARSAPQPGTLDYPFDTSKLGPPPPARLPRGLLKVTAFEQANVVQAFAGTLQGVAKPERIGKSRTAVLSEGWRIERDPLQGALLVARRQLGEVEREPEAGEPGKVADPKPPEFARRENKIDDARAKALALERVTKFGIGEGELGPVASLRLVSQDLNDDAARPSAVELESYKTIFFRAINGVPVQGSRVVVTHWPDGALKRTLLHWPAIAERGNRLTTRLSVPEITRRAAALLSREGIAKGSRASLRWKYIPTPQQNGEVTLQLVAAVRVPAPEQVPEGGFAEPREYEVPVAEPD